MWGLKEGEMALVIAFGKCREKLLIPCPYKTSIRSLTAVPGRATFPNMPNWHCSGPKNHLPIKRIESWKTLG
jgi:hypothetical protein